MSKGRKREARATRTSRVSTTLRPIWIYPERGEAERGGGASKRARKASRKRLITVPSNDPSTPRPLCPSFQPNSPRNRPVTGNVLYYAKNTLDTERAFTSNPVDEQETSDNWFALDRVKSNISTLSQRKSKKKAIKSPFFVIHLHRCHPGSH